MSAEIYNIRDYKTKKQQAELQKQAADILGVGIFGFPGGIDDLVTEYSATLPNTWIDTAPCEMIPHYHDDKDPA